MVEESFIAVSSRIKAIIPQLKRPWFNGIWNREIPSDICSYFGRGNENKGQKVGDLHFIWFWFEARSLTDGEDVMQT